MYIWLKYVALAILALFIIGFFYDVVKHARAKGGQWKDILLRIIVWVTIFVVIVALNLWLNRNWTPDRCLFTIGPF